MMRTIKNKLRRLNPWRWPPDDIISTFVAPDQAADIILLPEGEKAGSCEGGEKFYTTQTGVYFEDDLIRIHWENRIVVFKRGRIELQWEMTDETK